MGTRTLQYSNVSCCQHSHMYGAKQVLGAIGKGVAFRSFEMRLLTTVTVTSARWGEVKHGITKESCIGITNHSPSSYVQKPRDHRTGSQQLVAEVV